VGIDGWQDLPEAYAFRYTDDSAGGPVLSVKCLVADGKLLLHAAAGSDAPVTAELDVSSYTDPASDDLLKGY
jgi:proteasome inhibitor subunit 1 (PI31)